jgi:hypothetical protein
MKNKILVLALIAAVLTAGLVLAGCHESCPKSGDCYYNANRPIDERLKDCGDNCISDRLKENSVNIHCDC